MKRIILFITLLFLAGCSKGIAVNIPDPIASSHEHSGYLVGSLGVNTVWPATGNKIVTTLNIRHIESKEMITVSRFDSSPDFETDALEGQLFTLALPAGHYELDSVHFKGSNGIQTVKSKSVSNVGGQIIIAPNQVTYIGQFITSSLIAKSPLWNTKYPSGFAKIHHDFVAERDKQILDDQHPELRALVFVPSPLDGLDDQRLISTIIE
ncbi:membrane lipoprotein lipid attachment site-containing protein [Photobacterium japonica]|uniref:hypothetical protein n=1 Tax=Photobacterium japonica TaxID=2910235 RepID=UPI003D0A99F5